MALSGRRVHETYANHNLGIKFVKTFVVPKGLTKFNHTGRSRSLKIRLAPMKDRICISAFVMFVCIILLASVPAAWAHTHRVLTINGQLVEFVVGWVVEPAYANEINAVDFWAHYINSTCPQGTVSTSCPVYGLDQSLRVTVTLGGQSQTISFSPSLSNDVPPLFYGEYTASLEPTVPGTVSFRIFGNIDGAAVNETFTCGPATYECVDPAFDIQFPQSTASGSDLQTALANAQSQISNLQSQVVQMQSTIQTAYTVAVVGVAIGIVGIAAGAFAMIRSRKRQRPSSGRKRN